MQTESTNKMTRLRYLLRNEKENNEACSTCFELRVPRKKNEEIFWKVPSNIYGNNFIIKNNKNISWFVNISKYHHREMGLVLFFGNGYLPFQDLPK